MKLKSIELEVKDIEQGLDEASKELKVPKELLTHEEVSSKRGLFKGDSKILYKVDVYIEDYLDEIISNYLNNAGIKLKDIKFKIDESTVSLEIDTDSNALLIGKSGKTLNALQVYVRTLVNSLTFDYYRVKVDIGNYRDSRIKQLEIIATKTAKEVVATNIEVKLTAMNSFERKIIHDKLVEWNNVTTKSEGKEPNRCLVIKPKK